MRIAYYIIVFALFIFLVNTELFAQAATPPSTFEERTILFNALLKAGVLQKDRQLVHLSHVCNLQISGKLFPTIDIMELVKGATTPRGINRIVVLDMALVVVQTIDYTTERPLFCRGNQLFVFGDLMIDGVLPEGNVLTFTHDARHVEISQVDPNELPIPVTGTKPQILQ